MQAEDPPRLLQERTGRHRCIGCLAEVASESYFRNDYLCDDCAQKDEEFPLESTPEARGRDDEGQ